MSLYVSDSLKDLVDEDSLANDSASPVLQSLVYAEIFVDSRVFYFPVVLFKKKKRKDIVVFHIADKDNIPAGVFSVSSWEKVCIKANDREDIKKNYLLGEYKNKEIILRQIQQYLYGYNYEIAIIINNV